jgi:hypothetical protein
MFLAFTTLLSGQWGKSNHDPHNNNVGSRNAFLVEHRVFYGHHLNCGHAHLAAVF